MSSIVESCRTQCPENWPHSLLDSSDRLTFIYKHSYNIKVKELLLSNEITLLNPLIYCRFLKCFRCSKRWVFYLVNTSTRGFIRIHIYVKLIIPIFSYLAITKAWLLIRNVSSFQNFKTPCESVHWFKRHPLRKSWKFHTRYH